MFVSKHQTSVAFFYFVLFLRIVEFQGQISSKNVFVQRVVQQRARVLTKFIPIVIGSSIFSTHVNAKEDDLACTCFLVRGFKIPSNCYLRYEELIRTILLSMKVNCYHDMICLTLNNYPPSFSFQTCIKLLFRNFKMCICNNILLLEVRRVD